jgi:DNA-binding NarL/FixJ family response regulator
VRVVIAEDQALLREGLARLFEDAGDEVAGQAGEAQALLAAVVREQPDLAVVDIRMPPSFTDEGARAAAEIRVRVPSVGVLVLSQHVETRYAAGLVGEGGFGYLLKDRVLDVAEFLDAARRVAAGGSALDPTVVGALIGRRDGGPLAELTAREHEILSLMAEGLTNAGIGRRLFLAERTVESHVRSVLMKVGLPAGPDDHRRVLAVLTYLRTARS